MQKNGTKERLGKLMKWSKDDPLYYRDKLKDLIKQAKENGLGIDIGTIDGGVRIYFIGSNGDTIGANVLEDK